MPSIHDSINADTSQNKDLISFPKNAPQELPDDPVELYETTVKIKLDELRSAGQTPNYKESFLAIEMDEEQSIRDSEGFIRLVAGYVVHPGDSKFNIGDLISIRCSNDNKVRFNVLLKDRFYITAPDKDGTFPAFKGVVDVIPTLTVIEEPTEKHTENKKSSNTIDLENIRNRDKKLDSCMKSIRSMIDVVDEKLFKVKFNQFIGSLKISEKIKKASGGDPEEVKKYYEALRMFYDKRMHNKKMENAVKHYDRDMEVFKSLHGIANKYNLAHKKWF